MRYVVDTHALLWHLYRPKKVGAAARDVLSAADEGIVQIFVPAVALAEMLMVVQKERLSGVSLESLLEQLSLMAGSENYVLSPLRPDTVLASHAYTEIPDIFDRLIATEALRAGLPLLSKDPEIRSSGLLEVIWA